MHLTIITILIYLLFLYKTTNIYVLDGHFYLSNTKNNHFLLKKYQKLLNYHTKLPKLTKKISIFTPRWPIYKIV